MQKLRAWFYLKNNKKRAAILVVSFGLYFALLYGVRFFINPMHYTDEAVYLGNSELMQLAYVNQASMLPMDLTLWEENSAATTEDKVNELNRAINEFAQKLEEDERIDHVFSCYIYGITINTLAGSANYRIPMVTKEQARLICDYFGVRLIEGSYPSKPGDIVMDERMAKNRGFSVGDSLYDEHTRLCGIVSCDNYFAVGMEYDEVFVKRNLVFLDRGTIKDLAQFFQEYGWEASEKNYSPIQILLDLETNKRNVDKSRAEMEQPLSVMVYTITFVMGVTLYFVYQLHIKDRYEEWCLYRSLGYSQREVFLLALKEYGICLLGSGLLALIFLLIIFYFGINMMESKGIVYRLWIPETVLQLSALVVLLTGILQIPVYQAMQHIKTIDAIEDDI